MKKVLITVTMVSLVSIGSLHAGWRDYLPSIPSWQDVKSAVVGKDSKDLTEKEQLIQSAKKYALAGAGLLGVAVALNQIYRGGFKKYDSQWMSSGEKTELVFNHYLTPLLLNVPGCRNNILCILDRIINHPGMRLFLDPIMESVRTLITIGDVSRVASLACFGKASYDLFQAHSANDVKDKD